jgi:stage V sporulation protein G
MFQITDVKISLNSEERGKLKALVTMTLDNVFVVRDLKIIDGKKGLFVAMPCTQLTERCPRCNRKNSLNSRYCSNCGRSLVIRGKPDSDKRKEEYRDIAHPICRECRDYIENTIVGVYKEKFASIQTS